MTRGPTQSLVARDDDTDDVRWALQTALAQLKQGGQADAIVWVRRAAEAADAAGYIARGEELRGEARRLAQAMWDIGASAAARSSDSLEIEIDVDVGGSVPPSVQSSRSVPPPLPSQAPAGRSSRPSLRLRPPPGARAAMSSRPPPPPFSAPPPPFSVPVADRSSLAEINARRAPMPSAPDLEVEELDPEALGFSLSELESRPPPQSVPAISTYPRDTAADSTRRNQSAGSPSGHPGAGRMPFGAGGAPFNDRISSVDIEPLSVDAMMPEVGGAKFDSVDPRPTTSVPPGPDSMRRALALIDEEEVFADDEDRVTYDLLRQDSAPPSSIPRSIPPSSFRPSSYPPRTSSPATASPGSVAPQSRPPRSEAPQSRPPGSGPASSGPSSWRRPSTSPPPAPPSDRIRGSSAAAHPASSPPRSASAASRPPSRLPARDRVSSQSPVTPRSASAPPEDLDELTLEVSDLGPPGSAPPPALPSSNGSVSELPASAEVPPGDNSPGDNEVDGIQLDEVQGFEDLPREVQVKLAATARIEQLSEGEEVAFFGAAVVTSGSVNIQPAISDDSGAIAHQADVVFTNGTLPDSIALRVVARMDETRVAVWDPDVLNEALQECPWVHDELRFIADYFLAVCGAALGPLGERLDDSLRTSVFKRLEVRALQPREVLLAAGENIHSLFVVGGGRLELHREGAATVELPPGGFVFPDKLMTAQNAPCNVRAGDQGALVLFAPRAVAHELMMSVPPLLEVLAG